MGRPASQPASAAQPLRSLCAPTGGRTTRTDERAPAPRRRDSATAFWNLSSLGHWALVPCIRARQCGRSPISSSPINLFSLVALTDKPTAAGLHRDTCAPAAGAAAAAVAEEAEAAANAWASAEDAPPFARTVASCGLSGHMFSRTRGGGLVGLCAWAPAPCQESHTGTHQGPALQPPRQQRNNQQVALTCVSREAKQISGTRDPLVTPPPPTWKEAPVNVPRPLLEGAWKGPLRKELGPSSRDTTTRATFAPASRGSLCVGFLE